MNKDSREILAHHCNDRCMKLVGYSGKGTDFACRKTNNLKASLDNTRSCNVPLGNTHLPEVIEILRDIDLCEPERKNEHGFVYLFKSSHPFFHPTKHIPPILTTDDYNISPAEGKTFAVLRSMQNVQYLYCTNGVKKYVCKYVSKLDQTNYVVVRTHPNDKGMLLTKSQFLHNTKISSSAFNENKARENSRDSKHNNGRAIMLLQMVQLMLGYSEVFRDMQFITIPTLPLELRCGSLRSPRDTKKNEGSDDYDNMEDGADVTIPSHEYRKSIELPTWRQHSDSELLILNNAMCSSISLDKITEFSIRPAELRILFKQPGLFFRWFYVVTKEIKEVALPLYINSDIYRTHWIDGLLRQVRVRFDALEEIVSYIDSGEFIDSDDVNCQVMKTIFKNIFRLYIMNRDSETLSIDDEDEWKFYKCLIHYHKQSHLPVPVHYYLKLTNATRFLLHLELSLGHFSTEYDLILHRTIR